MTRWDKALVLFFCLLGAAIFWLRPVRHGETVIVRMDGREVWRGTFSKPPKRMTFRGVYGYNILEVGEDYIQVVEASCPNQLDVRRGKIRRAGESLVCLPNHFIATIASDEDRPDTMLR